MTSVEWVSEREYHASPSLRYPRCAKESRKARYVGPRSLQSADQNVSRALVAWTGRSRKAYSPIPRPNTVERAASNILDPVVNEPPPPKPPNEEPGEAAGP